MQKKQMIRSTVTFLTTALLLLTQQSKAGIYNTITGNSYTSAYTNEFFISTGYNYCKYKFIDVGVRYYHWKNDGQTAMAFAGASAGCEFSVDQAEQIYIPYIGWQGQFITLAYGLRAEYVISNQKQRLGFTPELGFSLFEILRITGGYRFRFDRSDCQDLNDFRFSIIAALPLSLFKTDTP